MNTNTWTANIMDTRLDAGVLRVLVEFTKGDKRVAETFETTQAQSDSWIQEQVARKIKDLEGVEAMHSAIEIGEVVLDAKAEEAKTAESEYLERLNDFNRLVNAFQQGFLDKDAAALVEGRKWLKENFKPEYSKFF